MLIAILWPDGTVVNYPSGYDAVRALLPHLTDAEKHALRRNDLPAAWADGAAGRAAAPAGE